jgi:glycosyltransferase involved in cell wall biosynthesis
MKKFKILIPCYNDWKSVFKLLEKIDSEIQKINNAEFSVIIVNDCSTEKITSNKAAYKKIRSIDIINIKKNQGHTKCYATGIKYLSKKLDFDYLLLMDGDGEDDPKDLSLLISSTLEKKNSSFVARRIKRSEGLIFTCLYNIHKIMTLIFTGKNMNFGHYSCLTKNDAMLLSTKKSLWSNFAGTAKKFIFNLDNVPSARGSRYFGPSKMPLSTLVLHSFSIIATFKHQVLFRSLVMISISSMLFFIKPNLVSIVVNFLLTLFCILIFVVARRENLEELNNSESRIENITNIHTIKL